VDLMNENGDGKDDDSTLDESVSMALLVILGSAIARSTWSR
jgi:hypothetical protein